ncbi:hypothetical protein Tco_0538243 [Tanacetum coccineum]
MGDRTLPFNGPVQMMTTRRGVGPLPIHSLAREFSDILLQIHHLRHHQIFIRMLHLILLRDTHYLSPVRAEFDTSPKRVLGIRLFGREVPDQTQAIPVPSFFIQAIEGVQREQRTTGLLGMSRPVMALSERIAELGRDKGGLEAHDVE